MSNSALNWLFGSSSGSNVEDQKARDFLDQWTEDLGDLKLMYGDAQDSISGLDDYISKLGDEYDSFQETFSPYRDQLLEIASSDGEKRSQLAEQFMSLAEADYQGASNRAVTDAAVQGDIARKSLVQDLNRRGTVSGARMENELRKSYLDEARMRTLASTQAQQKEKDRALTASATGIQLFDPTDSINSAAKIQTAANNLLTSQSDLATTQAGLQTQLANSYSNNVTEQLADTAGTYQGLSTALKLQKNEDNSGNNKTVVYTPTYSKLMGKYV